MSSLYDYFTYLQYKVKALKAENDAFKSGEKYLQMQEQRRKDIAYYERKLAALRRDLADRGRTGSAPRKRPGTHQVSGGDDSARES